VRRAKRCASPRLIRRATVDSPVGAAGGQAVFAYFKKGAQSGTPEYAEDLNASGVKDSIEHDGYVADRIVSSAPVGAVGRRRATRLRWNASPATRADAARHAQTPPKIKHLTSGMRRSSRRSRQLSSRAPHAARPTGAPPLHWPA